MARKTYLQLVNAVLTRLREDTVTSVSSNNYSELIGILVNEAKREVEDAHSWNAMKTTVTFTTTTGGFSYTLTGAGQRFTVVDVYNTTSDIQMHQVSTSYMNNLIIANGQQGDPYWYNFNGSDSNGDTQVDIYPIPNGAYDCYFNLIVPQSDLVNDTDTLYIPDEPVILNAYARAALERGEDNGLTSSEAYSLARRSLGSHIAIELSRHSEETMWSAV